MTLDSWDLLISPCAVSEAREDEVDLAIAIINDFIRDTYHRGQLTENLYDKCVKELRVYWGLKELIAKRKKR